MGTRVRSLRAFSGVTGGPRRYRIRARTTARFTSGVGSSPPTAGAPVPLAGKHASWPTLVWLATTGNGEASAAGEANPEHPDWPIDHPRTAGAATSAHGGLWQLRASRSRARPVCGAGTQDSRRAVKDRLVPTTGGSRPPLRPGAGRQRAPRRSRSAEELDKLSGRLQRAAPTSSRPPQDSPRP